MAPTDDSSSAQSTPPAYVKSLARGLDVIKAFDSENPQMSLADVARATDMTRASSRRFLLTLEELGYVRAIGREFVLTPKVLEIGNSFISTLPFFGRVRHHLAELSVQVSESTSAAILDSSDIVIVSRVPHQRLVSVSLALGTRYPAWMTATGRVLMATLDPEALEATLANTSFDRRTEHTVTDLEELRTLIRQAGEQGWSLSDGEIDQSLMTVAAPISDGDRVVAAINVAAPAHRESSEEFVARVLDPLLATAEHISSELDTGSATS